MGCRCSSCGGGRAKRTSIASRNSSVPKPALIQRKTAGAIFPVGTFAAGNHSYTAPAPGTAASLLKPLGPPKPGTAGTHSSRVDEEGTPDVYRILINRLKKERTLDEPITENLSLDWRAGQECLPKLKEGLKRQPNWLPRSGEIVLFVRDLGRDVSIVPNSDTGAFMLYQDNEDGRKFIGYPKWEAGQVSQMPTEQITLDDLVEETNKAWSIAYSGVRVEPLPDVNSTDKSLSKQHKYVPVHHTRPFTFWRELLRNTDENTLHPTIKHALAVMSTMSLVDTHRFQGTWPQACIYASAIYIGAELLTIGDSVRLLPLNEGKTTDILVIASIRLIFDHLDHASDNDYDEGWPYNSTCYIYGKGYTIDQGKSNKLWLTDEYTPPEVLRKYKADHPRHKPEQEMKVPFSRVLGRLFDPEPLYVQHLTDDMEDTSAALDLGREGLIAAREFARKYDQRIDQESGAKWYWANSRAEALGVQTINGLEVSAYQREPERVPRTMRQHSRVLEAAEKEHARLEMTRPTLGPRLKGFMAPRTHGTSAAMQRELPVRTESADTRSRTGSILPTTENNSTARSNTGTPKSSKKRGSDYIMINSDEDDDGDVQRDASLLSYARQGNVVVKKVKGVMMLRNGGDERSRLWPC